MSRVTFATSCWEKDWKQILLDPDYLPIQQIENHQYNFSEKILIINNVSDLEGVKSAAESHLKKGVLTKVIVAEECASEFLPFFGLSRSDFANDWIYYNALAPLSAIYSCKSEFLLYMTGDVFLEKPVRWIDRALSRMRKKENYKVANLTWNQNYEEAKKECHKKEWYFYVSRRGFSDQMFLIKKEDFCQPIYREIHPDSHHFPRGDVFEKRIFSAMMYRGWERITYRSGSYTHKNF